MRRAVKEAVLVTEHRQIKSRGRAGSANGSALDDLAMPDREVATRLSDGDEAAGFEHAPRLGVRIDSRVRPV
jgi:hypothetical protein